MFKLIIIDLTLLVTRAQAKVLDTVKAQWTQTEKRQDRKEDMAVEGPNIPIGLILFRYLRV